MKKGQVAIWVILALVLAGAIILFAVINRQSLTTTGEQYDPKSFIEECTTGIMNEALDKMLPQGGFLEPKVFKVYNDTKIAYLCKSEGYYIQCINLHPMLLSEMTNQIEEYSKPKIEGCFDSMKKEAEKKHITIETGGMNLSVSLAPREAHAVISREIIITQNDIQRKIDKINVKVLSPAYDLAQVAMNIANNERKYCYFEYVGYMALDRSVNILKDIMSDSTIIYTIKDKQSGKIMNIATRSCAMPVGL